MNAVVGQNVMGAAAWETLTPSAVDDGFSVREAHGHFRHTSRNEAVVRFAGIVIVLGAFVQWLAPNASFAGDPMVTKVLLSVAFSTVGIAVYGFAMRGHRSEIALDPARQTICISHLSRQNTVRSTKRIPLKDITSIYVRKAETPGGPAKMRIKLRNKTAEITAIRGQYEEVEMMHRQLCRNIRMLQG
ncbi:hypothetical protein FAP39_02730 [Shimia litoralis]|uniref:Uncharacterized protein n=1 Tax=Shimia litoralis TaxID=420403 RepID=A0A4U7N8U0_9RHOB|nr:hypothetical protein [Shimia litoralis]TKZ22133.1 hypothetical protein FAP39_02730 [Shimia litoralis]